MVITVVNYYKLITEPILLPDMTSISLKASPDLTISVLIFYDANTELKKSWIH